MCLTFCLNGECLSCWHWLWFQICDFSLEMEAKAKVECDRCEWKAWRQWASVPGQLQWRSRAMIANRWLTDMCGKTVGLQTSRSRIRGNGAARKATIVHVYMHARLPIPYSPFPGAFFAEGLNKALNASDGTSKDERCSRSLVSTIA